MTDVEEQKTVLLFSPFFYPENISTGRYNTHLALALQQQGNAVITVCSYPFYPDWEVATNAVNDLEGIEILRGGGKVKYPGSQVFRRLSAAERSRSVRLPITRRVSAAPMTCLKRRGSTARIL